MRMTAVICTRNRPDLIGRAVASVLANDHPDFGLIVVDQSDSGATHAVLDGFITAHPNLCYVHTTRAGLSAAYNTAISRGTGAILAFTDDDCVAPPDWLRCVEAAFEREPDADLLYGQVLMPAALRGVSGVVPEFWIDAPRRISRRGSPIGTHGMGANFAARRRLFERIGGFDEVLGGGGPLRSSQDLDLQYRVYRAGLVTVLAPDVRVDHYGLRTRVDWPRTLLAYGVGDGGFYMKHVRCGDLYAAWLLARKLTLQPPREVAKALLRRPHNIKYVRGLVQGLRDSFRFAVDRERRVYISL